MSIFRRTTENGDAPAAVLSTSERAAGSTWIGEHTRLEGKIITSEDICIQGRLTGVVESEASVLIPEGGRVKADISARSVTIHGQVIGNIEAIEQAEIGAAGSLIGVIYASSVVVRAGAVFEGTVRRRTREGGGSKDAP